jgi:hypothetical protein
VAPERPASAMAAHASDSDSAGLDGARRLASAIFTVLTD